MLISWGAFASQQAVRCCPRPIAAIACPALFCPRLILWISVLRSLADALSLHLGSYFGSITRPNFYKGDDLGTVRPNLKQGLRPMQS